MSGHAPGRRFYSLPEAKPTPDRFAWLFTPPLPAGLGPDGPRRFAVLFNDLAFTAMLAAFSIHIRCPYPAGPERDPEYHPVAQPHVDALLDLGRAGRHDDFLELARMLGVDDDDLEPLWRGTVRRLGREPRRAEVPRIGTAISP